MKECPRCKHTLDYYFKNFYEDPPYALLSWGFNYRIQNNIDSNICSYCCLMEDPPYIAEASLFNYKRDRDARKMKDTITKIIVTSSLVVSLIALSCSLWSML